MRRFLPLTLLVLSVPAAAADKIWTELDARARRSIDIPSVAPLVERSAPAILVVLTENDVSDRPMPPGHPTMPLPPGGVMQGEGTGFVIHPSGYAVTNNHVIENARSIRVKVGNDSEEYPAVVVGADPKTDVALIRIDSPRSDWPVLPLGDSDALKVGDFVVAIGNPFGLAQSVSLGIISARGRRDINPSRRAGIYDFLQTDASINPGNSGGPLMNLAGEVVGINTAVNAAANGIGFAIPVNMVKTMLPDLREKGRVVRSWIGVGIGRVTPELAKGLGLKKPAGALVRQVVAGGPAASAGIEPGDVITHFDAREIGDANELPLVAGDAGVGRPITLRLVREGVVKEMPISLGEHPDNLAMAPAKTPEKSTTPEKPVALGLKIVSLNAEDRARLGLDPSVKGARVVGVEPGSSAAQGGLMPDDIVLKVGGVDVPDANAFAARVKKLSSGSVLRLLVRRQNDTLFVAIVKP
jgi:serine protease Do